MKKEKLLCILHRSPPFHGAAKVGDFIAKSQKLQDTFDCKFITIKSSDTISDIGKVNFKKLFLVIDLYIRILWALLSFRPDRIYFTSSVKGAAFYRDVLISTLWKTYRFFKRVDIYYHYHTKGVDDFVSSSAKKLQLTQFFVKGVNVVLLSPMLEKDFAKVQTFKQMLFLPNGVEDNFVEKEFEDYIEHKNFDVVNILYLSNMIKSKGYFEVLKLAKLSKDKKYHFYFAGGWQNTEDEKEFFAFIKENHLDELVSFHGFVNGKEKRELFMQATLFIFPTKYENEAFPLSILEAFSYGLPVLSTDEGSIPFIIDDKSGAMVSDLDELPLALNTVLKNLVDKKTAYYCRKRYLDNFSLEIFEDNLLKLLKSHILS